ncbi:MAG: hypothetical protein PVH05_03240, partial [Burkholderiales bacterium]
MSDLQIGLLIVGLIVIGSVIAFNWYQEKQFRQRAERGFKRPEADALLSSEQSRASEADSAVRDRIDPHLGVQIEDTALDDAALEDSALNDEVRVQDEAEPQADSDARPEGAPAGQDEKKASRDQAAPARAPAPSGASTVPMPDLKINYVAEIRAGEVLPTNTIQTLDAMLKAMGRKCQLFGFDYNKQAWTPVADGEQWYTSIKVYVQLVDRGGAITRDQLENIVDLVNDQSKEVSAICEAPDVDQAMTTALALDDF